METLWVLCGLSYNRKYVHKPMFMSFVLYVLCIVYSIRGVFHMPMAETAFVLNANKKKTKRQLLSFFHICLLLYLSIIYEKSHKNLM